MQLIRRLLWVSVAGALAACAAPTSESDVSDPLETMNRTVHGMNKGLDQLAARPVSSTYGTIIPEPIRRSVNNVVDTLELPSAVLNDILQADIDDAVTNSLRFGLNATLGFGGIFDVASSAGMPKKSNDFGATLATWGVGEGAYVELPAFGPSTARDTVGLAVDIVTNPVGNWVVDGDADAVFIGKGLSRLNDRYRYSRSLDSILYDSADSYAQARLLYLQNRRFELGQSVSSDADFIDPYEDPYAE